MSGRTYPFPLAVNSSHHSHYHRFLLGAEASTLDPFPKPYCVGAMAGSLRALARDLNLASWRKLFHGTFPWAGGFGPGHYELGNVAPHRPLPAAYARPPRRFGAYDFVQVADPSFCALALVAGDRRVLERFVGLADAFCADIEPSAGARSTGPAGSRVTGRMLAGQFFEPNNRWLMPFLHVHSRVLNLTSFAHAPADLMCIDSQALARAAERAMNRWQEGQACALSELGYRVAPRACAGDALRVEGVSARLVATIEAPRIAVLRLLERIIAGDRPPSAERLSADLPPEVIAAMASQLEAALSRSQWLEKPPKIAVPPEGPWRGAVREHLARYCPDALAAVDAAAVRAGAVPIESAIFPTPRIDAAHGHAPDEGGLEASVQAPTDPELCAGPGLRELEPSASPWLAREFAGTLDEIHERLARDGPSGPLVRLGGILGTIDRLPAGADAEQLRQSALLLGEEVGRRDWHPSNDPAPPGCRFPLATLDELFESACMERAPAEREYGGRCL